MAEEENTNQNPPEGDQNEQQTVPPTDDPKEKNTTRAQGRRSRGKASAKKGEQETQDDPGETGSEDSEDRPQPMGSKDKLTDIKAAQGPLQPTALDHMGVERIVGPAVDDRWRPAPVTATEEEKAHRVRVAENDAARREERLGATQVPREHQAEGVDVARGAFEAERTQQGGEA